MTELPKVPQFEGLRWEDEGEDLWLLREQDCMVGEVYKTGRGWKWHCKMSDWRSHEETMEAAKLACVVSHVKELMYRYAMARCAALTDGQDK